MKFASSFTICLVVSVSFDIEFVFCRLVFWKYVWEVFVQLKVSFV